MGLSGPKDIGNVGSDVIDNQDGHRVGYPRTQTYHLAFDVLSQDVLMSVGVKFMLRSDGARPDEATCGLDLWRRLDFV